MNHPCPGRVCREELDPLCRDPRRCDVGLLGSGYGPSWQHRSDQLQRCLRCRSGRRWCRLGIGKIGAAAVESMARQPEVAPTIQLSLIIAAALIEGFTLFAVFVCMQANG